ncbi:MAG: type 4a pilus biogenesis protein PilO, partial [Candidatus Aureabacteria bacterium]|nr:type 4a pilus biogenesis protein PilO [Candidatus Auribacterota bacterium]
MEKKQIQLAILGGVIATGVIVLAVNFVRSRPAAVPGAVAESPGTSREQLMKEEVMVKRLPQQRVELAELQKKRDAVAADLPFESDHTWLSRQINQIAAATGVSDVSQRYQAAFAPEVKFEGEAKDRYAEKTWEIRMRCGYHDLGKFLNKIEEANRFLEVKEIG